MKILVAGGAGFIGSFLCDAHLFRGDEVIALDNLSTGHKENVAHLKSNPKFKLVVADVTAPPALDFVPERIYHLASPASPSLQSNRSYHALAFETMLANTTGTWNLCELAMKNKARLLFASTSEVYGEPLEHPQKETYRGNVSTTGPRAVYDEAKRFGETVVSAFWRKKGLDGRIVRIFNTYGPRMDVIEGRVVYTFMRAALGNKPLPLEGKGSGTRSFCYVTDLVRGLVKFMDTEKLDGEVINLGNPEEFTIRELADKIVRLTGSRSGFNCLPAPQDMPTRRRPDITKARRLLDWEPEVGLDEGLEKTLNYLQTVLS